MARAQDACARRVIPPLPKSALRGALPGGHMATRLFYWGPILAMSAAWSAYTRRMNQFTDIDAAACERARIARDRRFDGRFFVGVRTTGIYCRPICPANLPKKENVCFFPSAAAAGEAGFRPCLRCRPECAPGTPAWAGTSTTVERGLRLIANGALDEDNIERLADRLGVTSRHLRRLFTRHVGASPLTRRRCP